MTFKGFILSKSTLATGTLMQHLNTFASGIVNTVYIKKIHTVVQDDNVSITLNNNKIKMNVQDNVVNFNIKDNKPIYTMKV